MTFVCLALLASLLVVGALIDMRSRRLPNWLTATVPGIYVLYTLFAPFPVDWSGAVIVGSVSFVVGFGLFSFGLMGGGDVKLISGLSLWAGMDHIAILLVSIGLAGGVMSLVYLLVYRAARHPLIVHSFSFAVMAIGTRLNMVLPSFRFERDDDPGREDTEKLTLPYGVAIAAGGFVLITILAKL